MSMNTVVITIGRNVGETPMLDLAWSAFKSSVRRALASSKATVIQRPHTDGSSLRDQVGQWEGGTEGAATFVAFIHESQVAYLRQYLYTLLPLYKQEAIGFIVVDGTDHLIGA